MPGQGFLAIWTEIEQEHLKEYRNWLTREHIGQRIFSPGFLAARVHVSLNDERSHFILYATENEAVLGSQPYLETLNNPTPWTLRMMPRLRGFDRAAGSQMLKCGDGTGAFLVVSRIRSQTANRGTVGAVLSRWLEAYDVVAARLLRVDRSATDLPSEEKTMRSGTEGAFQYLLAIESTSEARAVSVRGSLDEIVKEAFGEVAGHDGSVRRLVYSLFPFERSSNEEACE